MPATRVQMVRGGKTVLKYSVTIPGNWAQVDDEVRAAWNRATHALGELAALIEERTADEAEED
ncbi:hypothetical protein Cali_49 [Mycobacterium phage Cali]|uniref:Uncharacterized protein n=11 Tax=Bixzunavirus TaxID=680114 RepID=A0A411CBP6_9CAUD|nr:gp49 [Mycobacterium phage Cali]YP_003347726.1 hypothetical protein ET08_43 [Mycobacterium phage ET08]YP_008061310.1 hypothetical protein M180_gp052 [Mycobacterium phage ArcherS7]YP_010057457.1 hypothetical protein KHO60_gp049 [Mycobacterium phage CharlieB]YP_010058145.1 hypothetical protein KHO63_gp046 [Mycobacterium phage QBert]YP_010058375.1 hypothetical protein KHO64_gp051 [Mycobacterium phage Quasimodo]YP_010058611.1 hypothetical protein KHO65_gp052 [Mycobacterium phage Sauce]AEJ94914